MKNLQIVNDVYSKLLGSELVSIEPQEHPTYDYQNERETLKQLEKQLKEDEKIEEFFNPITGKIIYKIIKKSDFKITYTTV